MRNVTVEDAIAYLYGGDDVEIRYWKVKRIRVRFKQICCSVYHGKRTKPIKPSEECIRETALIEGMFRTAYTCLGCVDKAVRELSEPMAEHNPRSKTQK